MSSSMSRRSFAVGSLATIVGASSVSLFPLQSVAAQEGADLASLGLPTLDVAMTATAYEGIPAETAAGRYLVNLSIPEDMEFGGGVAFMSPPAGMGAQEFLDMAGVSGGAGDGGASPEAEPPMADASPPAGGEEGEGEGPPPLFIYKATFAGGAAGMAGTTAQSVIDLTPGEWIAWGDDPSAQQAPVIFTVTDTMQADSAEPEADLTVTFIDFGITVEGALTAGDHVMLLQNHGAQPHFLFLAKGPDSMTNDQIAEVLDAEMSGMMTPEALPFNPDTDLMPVAFTATQSIDTMQWVPMSLDAGTYAALCFFPTAGEGLPHAYHGMHTVFTVE